MGKIMSVNTIFTKDEICTIDLTKVNRVRIWRVNQACLFKWKQFTGKYKNFQNKTFFLLNPFHVRTLISQNMFFNG